MDMPCQVFIINGKCATQPFILDHNWIEIKMNIQQFFLRNALELNTVKVLKENYYFCCWK